MAIETHSAVEGIAVTSKMVKRIAAAAKEAVAVRAEGDAARAAEREAGARALRAAVEAARPALPLIAERNDYVIEGEPTSLQIATLGGRMFGEARVQLGLDLTGNFVDVAYEYERGAWTPTSISPVSAEFVACYYDVEKLVAVILRAVEAQAQSKGTRRRTAQAQQRARRLGAVAVLIEACAQDGVK